MKSITVIPARKTAKGVPLASQQKLRVAAYCRVSTDSDEQATSYDAQIKYYTELIENNPEWTLAGIFADEGISGTNTKKRDEFNRMIEECKVGNIDMVLTKSISRFARNTLDCLKYIRMLKEKGVEPKAMGVEVISDAILAKGVAAAAKFNFDNTVKVLQEGWPEAMPEK